MVGSMNGTNGGAKVLVLYKVSNAGSDHGLYNAFEVPRGNGLTLARIKQHCTALHMMSHAGADGYHWRVRVDEKSTAPSSGGSKPPPQFSWWDIQDENAKLPIKEATLSELKHLFSPPRTVGAGGSGSSAPETATKAAKGAIRSLGKAMNAVVDGGGGIEHDDGPRTSVIAFKLLDLVKMEDDFSRKYGHGGGGFGLATAGRHRPVSSGSKPVPPPRRVTPQPQQQQTRQRASPAAQPEARPARSAAPAPSRQPKAPGSAVPRVRPPAQPQQSRPAASAPPRKQPEASLMDFGNDAPKRASPPLHHTVSSPAAFNNETRAQRLKREYEQNQKKQNRVWDEVDQRWVAVDTQKGGAVSKGSTSAPPGASSHPSAHNGAPKKKAVGIKLDPANAVGKSAAVQAAVNQRVNEMRESQQKAVNEIREREEAKKKSEEEEDAVRRRLEPKIKAWSEEHGKKKQLRALLANLHTILWPGANWKPISLADVLDASKCKKFYHKASRVVHPDKTHHLDAEQRFLAKRIFDALTQAKTEFDNSSN